MQPLLQRTKTVKHIKLDTLITAQELMNSFKIKSPTHSSINLREKGPLSTKSISESRSSKKFFETKKKEEPRIELKQLFLNNPAPPLTKNSKNKTPKNHLYQQFKTQAVRETPNGNSNTKSHILLPVCLVKNKENLQNSKNIGFLPCKSKQINLQKVRISQQSRFKQQPSQVKKQIRLRKNSNASTDVRSKHAISLQIYDQQDEKLFQARPSSHIQVSTQQKQSNNMLKLLEQTKKKLYQQIYSLDRKLMNDFQFTNQTKKHIVINLKKRKEIAQLETIKNQ